jgi:4-amino-4-deoxy-L-arabinose transferase-like glycosyltransferase
MLIDTHRTPPRAGRGGRVFDAVLRCGEHPASAVGWLTLLATWVLFVRLGAGGLEGDEGVYGSVARHLLASGDVVGLRFADQPYFNKPPLYMVFIAGASGVLGLGEWAIRLPAALFALGNVLMGYLLLRRVVGGGAAFLAMLLLLSHFHFLLISRTGRMESMVAFCILVACWALLACRDHGRWLLLAGAATGAAVLSKGAMGLLPLLLAPVFLWLDDKARARVRLAHVAAALAIAAAVALPWFVAAVVRYGDVYLQTAISEQVVDRIAQPLFTENDLGPLFYLHRISVYYPFTWSLLAPIALVYLPWRAWRERRSDLGLLALWMLAVILPFSLIVQTKLHWYVYAAYVPIAAGCALLLQRLRGRHGAVASALVVLSVAVTLAYPLVKQPHNLSQKEVALHTTDCTRAAGRLATVRIDHSPFVFYTQGPVEHLRTFEHYAASAAQRPACYVSWSRDLDRLTAGREHRVWHRSADHVAFSIGAPPSGARSPPGQ